MDIELKLNKVIRPKTQYTLSAEETNQITTELQNVITAAGLTPTTATLTQVRDAITQLISFAIDAIKENNNKNYVAGTSVGLYDGSLTTFPVENEFATPISVFVNGQYKELGTEYAEDKTNNTITFNYQLQSGDHVNIISNIFIADTTRFALDSDVVHKTGAENIAGNKTFTDNIVLYKHSPILLEVSPDMTRGTYVDNGGEIKQIAWDKNSNLLSELRTYVESNGNTSFCIGVCSQDENDTQIYKTVFRGTTRKDGQSEISMDQNAVVYAPTPAASNNSTQIATTAFVKSQTHLIETYVNGTSWYNVCEIHNPSTGALIGKWCEQGGITDRNGNGDTVNLLKTMPNTNYQVYMFCKNRQRYAWITSISTTQFKFNSADDNSANNDGEFCWCVKGYLE